MLETFASDSYIGVFAQRWDQKIDERKQEKQERIKFVLGQEKKKRSKERRS